jgi:hypothetical protein
MTPSRTKPGGQTNVDHRVDRARPNRRVSSAVSLSINEAKASPPKDRVAVQPTRYFLAYSNFGKALIASLVAPGSTNLPSCCFN